MYWNPEVLTRIDAADDLKIAPYLQVNIVNDFTVAKWRKVILFCHLRHNPSVLL